MRVHRRLLGLALAGLFGATGALAQQAPERFLGTVVDTAGSVPGRTTAFLTLIATQYTTDDEVREYARVLAGEGQEALVKKVEKLDNGRVQVGNRLSERVAIVRSHQRPDGGRTLRFVSARPIMFFEAYNSTRSRDYPFALVEIHLDASGKGEGAAIAAASLKFDEQGTLHVESYGIQPFKITTIEKQEEK